MPFILTINPIQVSSLCWPTAQEDKLVANDAETNDRFGYSVSISGDGTTSAIGSTNEDPGSPIQSEAGSAYVFTESGGTWTEEQKITPSDGESGDRFGTSVALSNNGDTAIVGAWLEDTPPSSAGAVYVYTRESGTWTERTILKSSDIESGDRLGFDVDVTNDGCDCIAGAWGENSFAGAAYVFVP